MYLFLLVFFLLFNICLGLVFSQPGQLLNDRKGDMGLLAVPVVSV